MSPRPERAPSPAGSERGSHPVCLQLPEQPPSSPTLHTSGVTEAGDLGPAVISLCSLIHSLTHSFIQKHSPGPSPSWVGAVLWDTAAPPQMLTAGGAQAGRGGGGEPRRPGPAVRRVLWEGQDALGCRPGSGKTSRRKSTSGELWRVVGVWLALCVCRMTRKHLARWLLHPQLTALNESCSRVGPPGGREGAAAGCLSPLLVVGRRLYVPWLAEASP